jgi:choline/glycine/proline betaine transport protein
MTAGGDNGANRRSDPPGSNHSAGGQQSSRPSEPDDTAPDLPSVSFGPHFEMHPIVFPAGAVIVLALVGLTFIFPGDRVQDVFEALRNWIGSNFGWLYVASLTGMLVFALWLAFGRFGRVKLGADDERPEFNRLTWFAMLFSAGMGIGLLFWSVAEPIYHYNTPPPGIAEGIDESRVAMAVTIFHWGLHPWALYAVVALALGYFGFRRGMPLGFRSLLHPILGDRVWGFTGDAIDTLAIIATLTGVATSLGIGAQQVNAGFAFLFGMPISTPMQVVIIACITAVATVSVVLGLGTGIRRLSEANMILAGLLMVLVILGSGVVAFLGSTVENIGGYLQLLPFNALRTGAVAGEGVGWLNSWTVFYWAWWISWSPFVGMFIARVSRGRTIREFILGVLVVPTVVGIIWLTAFGATTLRQHVQHVGAQADPEYVAAEELPIYTVAMTDDEGEPIIDASDGSYVTAEVPLTAVEYLGGDVTITNQSGSDEIEKLPTVLFALLQGVMPYQWLVFVAAGIATLCVVLFFVTSSDSASMVIDIMASGGNPDPPVGTRLFWAVTEGLVAATLLLAGGLEALQAASITAALPFTVILLLAVIALTRDLYKRESHAMVQKPATPRDAHRDSQTKRSDRERATSDASR